MKAIIFDLAGVVMNLNIKRDTEALHSIGLPDYAECLANDDLRKPLDVYLNGLCGIEEFLASIRPFCRKDVKDSEILWAMDAVLDDVPRERLEHIIRLRSRYRVFLLSNIYDTAWEHAVREIEKSGYHVEDCFEQVFLSNELRMAKPDARIFRKVVEETGIVPEETYYFDDTRVNIEAGKALGFHSFLVPMNRLEEVWQML